VATVLLPIHSGKSASVQTTSAFAAPLPVDVAVRTPQFIVQHTWACHFRVVSADPAGNGKSVDGVDYTDFDAAKTVRDRLNAEAAL
jgi:hypothetical protein